MNETPWEPSTHKRTTSHVQNVFCLAHQIITSTLDYSHLGMLITIARSALSLSLSLFCSASQTEIYIDARLITSFLFCWIAFDFRTKNIAWESNVMKIKTCPISFPVLSFSLTRSLVSPSHYHLWPNWYRTFQDITKINSTATEAKFGNCQLFHCLYGYSIFYRRSN